MKVTGNNGLGNMLKIILQMCFYGGIIVLILLPFVLKMCGLHLNATAFVIYPNGIILLIIAYQFIKLFDSLKQDVPFCDNNVKILKYAAIAAIVEGVLWLLDLLFELILVGDVDIMSIMALGFLFILFVGVAISLYILSELFREAAEYKRENELTI